MPNWNRIIVGDAFKLPSRHLNYYRDMFLMWPILLFSIGAISTIIEPQSPAQRVFGFKLAACAVFGIMLAKERLILIGGGAGFVALRLAFALALTQDWRAYLPGLLVSAGIVSAILVTRRQWKPSYESPAPGEANVLSILVGVAGLGAAVGIAFWLKP
ncbi:MAG TPA: hypothetical protein VJW51_07995 [Candidatus Acidoferrales bacterium]|nr:hypothetical protein [Candidatus Acidoferrales bacterium]